MKTKTETIDNVTVHIKGENAVTELLLLEDMASVQNIIDRVLDAHPDWTVAKVDFTYKNGAMKGKIGFSLPAKPPKTKRYLVEWKEVSICSSEVEAPNKKVARQLAEENFADSREYEDCTDWVITELKV